MMQLDKVLSFCYHASSPGGGEIQGCPLSLFNTLHRDYLFWGKVNGLSAKQSSGMSIPRFQPDKPIGEQFRVVKSGCSWCREGKAPAHGETICGQCVVYFHGLLTSYRYQKSRRQFLHRPGNQQCKCGEWAEEVHHQKPWLTHPDLFWDWKFWEAICKLCHNRQTIKQTQERRAEAKTPPPKPIISNSLIRDPSELRE